jgi:uncharacterized protein YndB with AHSA1/START domain
MDEFEIVMTINRPVEQVFAALQDLDKIPRWNSSLSEVRKTSDGPLAAGSKLVYIGRFLGRNYESPSAYSEFIADQSYVSKTTSGPFELEVATTLARVDGATKLTLKARGESRGFFKVAEPVVVRLTKRTFENAYENLKTLLEEDAL